LSYDLAVMGGTLLTGRRRLRADLGVSGGKVAHLGRLDRKDRSAAGRVVDAADCLVIPGAIDPHVHFDLTIRPGMTTTDDFGSGTRAAAAAGVTTVIDYTAPQPDQSPLDAFKARRKVADGAVKVDYGLHNVLISWRPEWRVQLAELARLGSPSVKMFMIYAERGWQADDGMLVEVMRACREHGLLACVHAENDSLINYFSRLVRDTESGAAALASARPPAVEEEAVARVIKLSEIAGARLHLVHLSTAGAARLVGAARRRGLRVSGETCPHYLVLDKKLLAGKNGQLFGCCPPLRGPAERRGLLQALSRGWLQAIATDHCTFNRAQKESWQGDFEKIPYGLPGVETSLPISYTLGPASGKLSLNQWVRLHSEGPARLFGLFPNKGTLQKGADADLVIWDPHKRRSLRAAKLQTVCDWSPYEGKRVSGMARRVFLRGVEIAREGRYLDADQAGKYVQRMTCR